MNGYTEFVADQPADRSTVHITRSATAVRMTIENQSRHHLRAAVLESAHALPHTFDDLPSQGSCTNNVEVYPMKKLRVIIDNPSPHPIDNW